ncbi:MAG TPA: flagellar basal body P-ring formation chaperone FlgA [Syntrophorhabdaceae bacterium]|jgi:flagella basal body P-ring formation protein FlgA
MIGGRVFQTAIAPFVFGAALVCLSLVLSAPAFSEEIPAVEKRLTSFIRDFYGNGEEIQIKFNNIPAFAKGKIKVKGINFTKVPDGQGDGLCLVEIEGKDVKERNLYVAFRVYKKKVLFVLKQEGKRGDLVKAENLAEKETFLTGAVIYPSSRNEVVGKKLKKDLAPGTIITPQVLEDQILVKSGDLVSIVAENPRLLIHANGKALDRGKMGETVRVKNITSGKEILGRVTGENLVTVEF